MPVSGGRSGQTDGQTDRQTERGGGGGRERTAHIARGHVATVHQPRAVPAVGAIAAVAAVDHVGAVDVAVVLVFAGCRIHTGGGCLVGVAHARRRGFGFGVAHFVVGLGGGAGFCYMARGMFLQVRGGRDVFIYLCKPGQEEKRWGLGEKMEMMKTKRSKT